MAYLYTRLTSGRYQQFTGHIRCFYAGGSANGRVACVYASGFSSTPATGVNLTAFVSHSNGIDLGLAIGYLVRMARRYGCDVFCYDYFGFGQSIGPCTEQGVYKSAQIAFDFLTKTLRVPADQIVAIGSSLGTTATIHLASTRRVRAVVIQGGFMSAYRVLFPFQCSVVKHDQYRNIDKIVNVRVPTLFIHGEKDEYFNIRHAKILRKNCPGAKNVEPLYLKDCKHTDFDEKPLYWDRMHDFLHKELVTVDNEDKCCSHRVQTAYWTAKIEAMIASETKIIPEQCKKPVVELCDTCLGTVDIVLFNREKKLTALTFGE